MAEAGIMYVTQYVQQWCSASSGHLCFIYISAFSRFCNIVTFIFSAFLCGDGAEERGDSDELFGGSVPYMAFMLEMTSA